jgi:DNA-binding XRE family transcriptional regulator
VRIVGGQIRCVKLVSIRCQLQGVGLTILCYSHIADRMTIFGSAKGPRYRSKAVRSGAALAARLFGPEAMEREMRRTNDHQASIRSALRRRRRTLGLTQQDAARLLGMQRLTYHRIETGGRTIHFAELAALCEAFHCPIGELVQDGQLAAAFTHAARALLGERGKEDPA